MSAAKDRDVDPALGAPPAKAGSSRASGNGSGGVADLRADLKAEVERAKNTVSDVKAELDKVNDERRGGPATSVDDATAKAADLRRALARDVASLRARVPDTTKASETARTVGIAVGGGAVALFGLLAVLKRRGAAKAHDQAVRDQALALARELARIERTGAVDDEGGRFKWALLATAAVGVGAGAVAWQRSRTPSEIDDTFGAPTNDPLRPSDVTSTTPPVPPVT